MHKETLLQELKNTHEYFKRSNRNLTEEHSTFATAEGQMTASQQMAHVAQTVEWFMEGAFRPEGFRMDWEEMAKPIRATASLAAAREWIDRTFHAAIAQAQQTSQDDWNVAMPPNPIFGEAPRWTIIGGIIDHTARHRGALTVYARLKGVTPPMPYLEMEPRFPFGAIPRGGPNEFRPFGPKAVEARSDIFSFGVAPYNLPNGSRAQRPSQPPSTTRIAPLT